MTSLFDKAVHYTKAKREDRAFHRAWAKARSQTLSATHRAEIDAIFSQLSR